jgi:V/A-type H+-transporting ATPase subunit D
MELLSHKTQLELAKQGRDLLEQKRSALMQELLRVAGTVMQNTDALQKAATEAQHELARAEAVAGNEAVLAAAFATRAELLLQVETVTVMGLKVPRIERKRVTRPMLARGYSVTGESITIDEAASAFEVEVDAIIQLAEIELRLTRLAAEFQRTSRRLNALDYALIPQMKSETKLIQTALDERERADHARLKRVSQALNRQRKSRTDN